jgi:pimeloyl-ACP methyl ester carboxylesterase
VQTVQMVQGVALRVGGPPDGEPVILLHGVPQTGDAWGPVAAGLAAAGRRVVVPDLPGLGRSEALASYGVPAVLARLVAALSDSGVLPGVAAGGSVDVVGHDWGGTLAIGLSSLLPVRRLAVISGPYKQVDLLRALHIPLFQLPVLPELVLRRVSFARFAYRWAWKAPTPPQAALVDADAASYATAEHLAAMLGYYRGLRGPRSHGGRGPAAEQLLVIWGAVDPVTPVRCAEAVMRDLQPALPSPDGARLVVLPGVGHFPVQEAPELMLRTLVEFLGA